MPSSCFSFPFAPINCPGSSPNNYSLSMASAVRRFHPFPLFLLLFFSFTRPTKSGTFNGMALEEAEMTKWNLTHFEQKIGNEMAENGTKEENGNGIEFGNLNDQTKNSNQNLEAKKESTERMWMELPPIDFNRDGRPQRASLDEDTAPPDLATPELASISEEDGDKSPQISTDFLRRLSAQQVASQRAKLHRGGNLLRGPVNFEEALRVTVPYEE